MINDVVPLHINFRRSRAPIQKEYPVYPDIDIRQLGCNLVIVQSGNHVTHTVVLNQAGLNKLREPLKRG
jgi:hypothetical protein